MSAVQSLKNSHTYVSILLIFEGLLFLIFPHLTTKLLFLLPIQTPQTEQYARALGLGLISVIGYYYYIAGTNTLIAFFSVMKNSDKIKIYSFRILRASVFGRLCILSIILVMIYLWSIELPFLVFDIQVLVLATCSYTCLKACDEEQAKTRKNEFYA